MQYNRAIGGAFTREKRSHPTIIRAATPYKMAAAQHTPERQWRAFFVSVAVVLAVTCGLNRMWSPISASSVWATLYRAAGEDPFTMHVTCKGRAKVDSVYQSSAIHMYTP